MRFLLLIFLPFFGCGASEESIREDWGEYVSDNNTCQNADQCIAVYPGCPLGCASAISKNAEADAIEKAGALVQSYSRFGEDCVYKCGAPNPLVCESNRCGFQR